MNTTDTAQPPVEPPPLLATEYFVLSTGSADPRDAELARLRAQLAAVTAEWDDWKERAEACPADWREDSSLKTWFPLTAELHEETLKQRLQLIQISGCPFGTALAEWVGRLWETLEKRTRLIVLIHRNAKYENHMDRIVHRDLIIQCDAVAIEEENARKARRQPPTSAPTTEQAPEGGA